MSDNPGVSEKTMIKPSIRAYSLNEIYHFIKIKEYPEEFLEYLQIVPGNIKKLLIDMGVEHEYFVINETKIEGLFHAEEKTIEHDNKNENENIQPNIDVKSEPFTIEETNKRQDNFIQENNPDVGTIDKSDSQDDETLYENMRFGDSITVNRLVLHEMKYPLCREHGKEYQNINVNISLAKGKFEFSTRCCPICKKLYIKKKNFQGVKEIFDRKKIVYAWIPEDE